MVRVIMHGAGGYMGAVVTEFAAKDEAVEIVAGVDVRTDVARPYPVFATLEECPAADVIIDFSTAKAVDGLIAYAVKKEVPLVLCTTGLSEEQLQKVAETSEKVAVLRSANMSLGVNLLLKLLKEAASVLVPAGFDAEIMEMHHRRKLDSPSGTAIALAESVNEGAGGELVYTFDRSARRASRDARELGVMALRGGTVPGTHDVVFAGEDELIEFKHTAYSRSIFAKGALQAAKYLSGKPAGMYSMADVIG